MMVFMVASSKRSVNETWVVLVEVTLHQVRHDVGNAAGHLESGQGKASSGVEE